MNSPPADYLFQAASDCSAVISEAKRLILSSRPEERGGDETTVEVEARLGRIREDGKFTSGVSEETFQRIVRALESYTKWSSVNDWSETQDFFYDSSKRQCPSVRTSVIPTTAGLEVKHFVKKIHRRSSYRMSINDELVMDPLDVRISCATETPVASLSLPVAVDTTTVRIKRRKSFYYASGDTPPMFSFDVTIVWQGITKEEAEKNQQAKKNANYEVEVECVSLSNYLSHCGGDSSCLALSLLSKMIDFARLVHIGKSITYIPSNALTR